MSLFPATASVRHATHRGVEARQFSASGWSALLMCLGLILTLHNSAILGQVKDPDKRLETAAQFIREQRIVEAEGQLNNILKATPNDPLAINMLGTIRAQQGRLNDAESLFLRAVRIDDRLIGARMNLAYLYALRKEPEKTIAQLEDVLRLDRGNLQAVDMLARLFLARGAADQSIATLENARQATALTYALHVLLGDAYLVKRDSVKAEEAYQRALVQQNDDADAVLGLARAAQLRGEQPLALQYLDRARKLAAPSPATLFRFATVASAAGLYEEANNALQAAIKLKADDPGYYLALGNTWLKKPDLFEAEKAFRAALKLDPDNPQAQMSLGYVLLEQKNYPEARLWLEKSLTKDKTIPETYYYLGLIAQEQNEDNRAIELFQSAIALAPDYSFPHAALGASYLKLRNYPQAKTELELSVKLNPNDARAHYSLAVLYARLKDSVRAQDEMKIVESLKKSTKQSDKSENSPVPHP